MYEQIRRQARWRAEYQGQGFWIHTVGMRWKVRGEAYEEGGERFAYVTASYQRESVEMAGIVKTSTVRLTLLWLS
jgi:hypothetical protein